MGKMQILEYLLQKQAGPASLHTMHYMLVVAAQLTDDQPQIFSLLFS